MSGIAVGATVRVKYPDRYLVVLAKKIADRDGIVEFVGPTKSGMRKGQAQVRFLKRNGRGKEFTERLYIDDLMLV